MAKLIKMYENNHVHYFFKNTSLHGFKYLVEKKRSIIEKIFWALVLIISYCGAANSLFQFLNLWTNNPRARFFENTESSIKDIPFPSITVCSKNQVRKWSWNSHINDTIYMKRLNEYYLLNCYASYYSKDIDKNFTENFDHEILKTFLSDCPVSCSELFPTNPTWQNKPLHNFCHYIQPIPTILGVCYVFNMIPAYQMFNDEYYKLYKEYFSNNITYNNTEISKWNMDDGYPSVMRDKLLTDSVVPARINGVGFYHRLSMNLHFHSDDFLRCISSINKGFLIGFSNPLDIPKFDVRTMVTVNSHTKIQVIPHVVKMASNLRSRSPDTRKCYLNNERKLKIYGQYTMRNCINECYINETLALCNCVGFNSIPMPNNVKVCSLSKKECIVKATAIMNNDGYEKLCNCWPSCSEIEYTIEKSSSFGDWSYWKKINLEANDSEGATVDIVFKSSHFTASKVENIFNIHQCISVIGGISGILLGGNLRSAFEIVYVYIKMIKNYFVKHHESTVHKI